MSRRTTLSGNPERGSCGKLHFRHTPVIVSSAKGRILYHVCHNKTYNFYQYFSFENIMPQQQQGLSPTFIGENNAKQCQNVTKRKTQFTKRCKFEVFSLKNMVGAEGFEPPTACSQSRCATRLRYAPKRITKDGRNRWLRTSCASRILRCGARFRRSCRSWRQVRQP